MKARQSQQFQTPNEVNKRSVINFTWLLTAYILVKEMMNSIWVEHVAKETITVAQSLQSENLERKAISTHSKEAEKRKELFSTWHSQVEDEVGDLVLEIDKDQEVFSFTKKGRLELRIVFKF